MMKKVTEYVYKGRTFMIAKKDSGEGKGYWAFEDKYIDEDGMLTKVHNGIEGCHSEKLADTLTHVKQKIDFDEYLAAGYTDIEASVLAVLGYLPEGAKSLQ